MKKKKITAKEFGKKVAKVMMTLQSSHCYFILQEAFGEYLDWNEAEEIMKQVINEKLKRRK